MYTITYASSFNKQLSKLVKKDRTLIAPINRTIGTLTTNPFYQGLRSHLVGNDSELGNVYSSRVTGDIRILWVISPTNHLVLILLKIGGHDFVY